ncbi:MAG: hypothetical protein WBL91_14280, partial [Pseudolabrys sp.]
AEGRLRLRLGAVFDYLDFRLLVHERPEDFAMAEINKLSVGQALDKLRRPDGQSKQTRLDEKMDALDEDMQRMRAMRRRIERDQRAAEMTASDAQGMNARPGNKKRPLPILAILAVVGAVLLVLIILYATLVQ